MTRKFPHLCSQFQIGNVTLKHRMASAPTGGTDFTSVQGIGRRSTAYYELKAKGGASVVTVSEIVAHPETDASLNYHLFEEAPASLMSFTLTADAIKRHGSVPSAQLSHGGRYGALWTDKVKYGPSGVKDENEPEVFELSKGQIKDIVASYGKIAGLAKRAGFEMVMIHGGHGWLLNQFMSTVDNKRTDEYGGSLENRCRLALEVIESVRGAVGKGFPIEFRMSAYESTPGGYGFDTGLEIAKILDSHIDLLHISAGSHHIDFTVSHPSVFAPHAWNAKYSAELRKHVKVPLAIVGAIGDPVKMEDLIASGQTDVLYMARALIADPYLPRKVLENRDEEIIKCLRCFTCNTERGRTKTRRCALNPLIGREIEGFEVLPSHKPQKVLVAGGGPGGMQAALTSAQRGHRTILCEKSNRLGGILNCEEDVPFKSAMFNYTKTMELLLKKEGVDIRLNTPVTADYAEKENVDMLICAIGSDPIIPPLPGVDNKKVILIKDKHERRTEIGQRVIVLGGGLAGCETALDLANNGKSVVIVEMLNELAPDALFMYREDLEKEFGGRVGIKLGYVGTRVVDEGLYCKNPDGVEELVEADTIILAAGQRARKEEADALRDAAPRVYFVGDCVLAKDIVSATYQGFHAAMDV